MVTAIYQTTRYDNIEDRNIHRFGGGGLSENNVLKWLLRPESEEITGGQRSVNWGAVEIAIRIKKLHLR